MTNERAIYLLGWLKCRTGMEEDIQAIDMAIKSLSAKPAEEWIPFHIRDLTEEELKEHPDWCYYLDCILPESEQEVLISSPRWGVYKDTFYNEGIDGCGLEGGEDIENGMAWMPLPEPYKMEVEHE